jgi:hypothetical protein
MQDMQRQTQPYISDRGQLVHLYSILLLHTNPASNRNKSFKINSSKLLNTPQSSIAYNQPRETSVSKNNTISQLNMNLCK